MGPRTKRGSPDGGLRTQALVRIVDRWRRLSGAMKLDLREPGRAHTPRHGPEGPAALERGRHRAAEGEKGA